MLLLSACVHTLANMLPCACVVICEVRPTRLTLSATWPAPKSPSWAARRQRADDASRFAVADAYANADADADAENQTDINM